MSIDGIQQAMELNRSNFVMRSAELRASEWHSETDRRRELAELWFTAMRTHYQLLGNYLRLRDRPITDLTPAPKRLRPSDLRAPQRPDELPESLSRYVTAERHAELLI
ncbi:MAG: hypothetical protein WBW04_17035 [Nitrolancea sp.]